MPDRMPLYGVYRVFAGGRQQYVSRSVTHSRKLAEEIAADLTRGEITLPTGEIRQTTPRPHVVKPIAS